MSPTPCAHGGPWRGGCSITWPPVPSRQKAQAEVKHQFSIDEMKHREQLIQAQQAEEQAQREELEEHQVAGPAQNAGPGPGSPPGGGNRVVQQRPRSEEACRLLPPRAWAHHCLALPTLCPQAQPRLNPDLTCFASPWSRLSEQGLSLEPLGGSRAPGRLGSLFSTSLQPASPSHPPSPCQPV